MNQFNLTPEQAGYLAGVLEAYLAANYPSINPQQLREAQELVKYLKGQR